MLLGNVVMPGQLARRLVYHEHLRRIRRRDGGGRPRGSTSGMRDALGIAATQAGGLVEMLEAWRAC